MPLPDSSSESRVRTISGRRGLEGWIRTGALLALRIEADGRALSPMDRLLMALKKEDKDRRDRGEEGPERKEK